MSVDRHKFGDRWLQAEAALTWIPFSWQSEWGYLLRVRWIKRVSGQRLAEVGTVWNSLWNAEKQAHFKNTVRLLANVQGLGFLLNYTIYVYKVTQVIPYSTFDVGRIFLVLFLMLIILVFSLFIHVHFLEFSILMNFF